MSSVTSSSLAAQLMQLADGLSALREDIAAMHEDVRRMVDSMLRSERHARKLLAEIEQGVSWLRRCNEG